MSVQFQYGENKLTALLSGEIDHHTAAEMRILIDGEVERTNPSLLILDFGNVSFMDSSGIGLIFGRIRLISGRNGKIGITNPKGSIRKVIALSGLGDLIIERKEKV